MMKGDVSIVLCGEAGQGIQTVEIILTRLLKLSGYNVFATKEYMSRVRGGINSTSIRIASNRVAAFADKIDILIPLNQGRTKHLAARISGETIILGERSNIDEKCREGECKILEVPFSRLAAELGHKIYANVIAVGVIAGLFKIDPEIIRDYISRYFSKKDKATLANNIKAALKGHEIGRELLNSKKTRIDLNKNERAKDEILLNGAEAVALGAIAGGCDFISAYPMSPSTGVLVFLSQHARGLGIVAEQAEDEVSAMNMALGAWYAGARALVSTSGGGYALMVEGLSLAGMLETPVVVHLAQRPGPATGLPTRTEQADLNFALYSGHGEFPRVIFSPGSIEEAFYLTQQAFNLADKYQIPVFVLTDQYLMDSYYNIPSLETKDLRIEKYVVRTEKGYKRYALTKDGVSPRGIPGYGSGLVAVDSDEHDEAGHITEDLEQRGKIVDKRLRKLSAVREESVGPELVGGDKYSVLLVGWGTTYHIIKEALARLNNKDISFLHFKQVYPLPPAALSYLKKARQVVIIENNATSQFSNLIRLETGFEIKDKILKYNGLPFSVEELVGRISEILGSINEKHG